LLRILAIEAGIGDGEVLTAALLHDYLEDCCGEKQEHVAAGRILLQQRFGDKVLACVDEVTDDKTLPKDERKRLQVEKAKALSYGAKLVKLADKIANLRDVATSPPAGWSIDRKREYFDWATTVVAELRGTHAGLESLFDSAYGNRP
jgi:guanosine-3',5'-bis(diphosphate) 3'-pyrophosphohydrolase